MPVTIKDVARVVGVSTSTVSRVLTGHPGIGAETRGRVLKAVAELKYQPNAVARSLVNNRSHMLCAVLPNVDDPTIWAPFFLDSLKGINDHARERGYRLVFLHAKAQDEEYEAVMEYVTGRLVDGVILYFERTKDKLIDTLRAADFPFLLFGNPEENVDALWVSTDVKSAYQHETARLLQLGHRRIGYVGGPRYRKYSKDRFDAFFAAHHEAQVPIDPSLVEEEDQYTYEAGERYVESRISGGERPSVPFTAIVTSEDRQSVGASRALARAGIRGVSIIGSADMPICAVNDPPLTSIAYDGYRMGSYSARLLIDRMEGAGNGVHHYVVRCKTVDRGSVQPPPAVLPAAAPAAEGARP